MPKKLAAPAAAVLALALAVPAFAGGEHCSGSAKTTTASAAGSSCGSAKSASMAWSGAWLQRGEQGQIRVAELAPGGPAQRSGLRVGDVVLAVNGYDLSDAKQRAMCASSAECKVGNAVAYKVQRGNATKLVKVKLTRMPADAAETLARRGASFEPSLAAAVTSATY